MRLLIIEDEVDTSTALAHGLKREGYAVDVATSGIEGWEMAEVNQYDLLILDLNLPDMDGLEVCRRLRDSRPDLLILMLTARTKPLQKIEGLDWGADDYLVKPFHFGELAARIRALLRRDLKTRDLFLTHLDLKLDPLAKIVWKGNRRLDLTRKEYSILEYLLHRCQEVVTQEELLEHVWDANADPFSSRVRVHLSSLRRKLGQTPSSISYIETVVGVGYRLGLPDLPENEDFPKYEKR